MGRFLDQLGHGFRLGDVATLLEKSGLTVPQIMALNVQVQALREALVGEEEP